MTRHSDPILCFSCRSLPRAQVTREECHRLPRTWRPIDEHPELRPGPWVPIGDMKGVVFCEECGRLWYLFLDPGQGYYTDVIELAPELVAIISENASLEDVLPLAVSGDAMLQLILRDWFALAAYDPSRAAQALIDELAIPELPSRLAVRLLDFLAAVIAGSGRDEQVVVDDASPIVELLYRADLLALDPVRLAGERNEIRRLVASIARAAFGLDFGGDRDRVRTSPSARARVVGVVKTPSHQPIAPVLGPPRPVPQLGGRAGVGQLVVEIEELLRDGASRVTAQEIAPLIDVVRRFWATESLGSGDVPRSDPGLILYRQCRDVLFALRHAGLIPRDSAREVEAALAIPSAPLPDPASLR